MSPRPQGCSILLLALLSLVLSCRGAGAPTTPPPPLAEAPPPPPPPVTLLELIPQAASGAMVFDVAAASEAQRGRELMTALLRLSEIERWEEVLGIDVEREVRQVVIHALVDPESGSTADLSRLFRRWTSSSMGLIIELAPSLARPLTECHEDDLARLVYEPVDGPLLHSHVARCGRFILTSCCVAQPQVPLRSSSLAARAFARVAAPQPGLTRLLTVVAGPEALNRATCDGSTIALTGWHSATVDLGAGVELTSWIHAASPAEASPLRQCIVDQLASLAAFPLINSLGLGDILAAARVEQGPDDEKDVLVSFRLDEQQSELLLSLIGAFDGGGLP